MQVAITGATGMIGSALCRRLEASGHSVVRVERRPREGAPQDALPRWNPEQHWVSAGAFDGYDAIVHLAGASIGEGRWTERRKAVLRTSRLDATRLLVRHLETIPQRPGVLISASAIGLYGDRGNELLPESAGQGQGFLAELSAGWEREARAAEQLGMRVATPRFGVVLDRDKGALPRMLTPIRFGVGGRLGNGKQWMPWVTLDDVTRAIEFLLTHEVRGAFNVVAPEPATNAEVTRAIGRVLHRPTWFPVPPFALRLLLGQAADELLLSSARVVPQRLVEAGFSFAHPHLDEAMRSVLTEGTGPSMATAGY